MADPTLCRRCGRCCCKKVAVGDELVYLPLFCEFLDEGTKLCKVYPRRHELSPQCLTVEEGIEIGVFPADCPYVRERAGYRPPREECTEEELRLYLQLTEGGEEKEEREQEQE